MGSSATISVGIGDDRPGDADPLLLAAGELAGTMAEAVGEGDEFQGGQHLAPPLRGRQRQQEQRQLDVLVGRQHRQEVVELEDEAEVSRPPAGQLRFGHRRRRSRRPPTLPPALGLSRPAMRFNSVVFPEPLKPPNPRSSSPAIPRSCSRRRRSRRCRRVHRQAASRQRPLPTAAIVCEIGFEDFLQAEQTGWVLYLEGSTDLAVLQSFAAVLEDPLGGVAAAVCTLRGEPAEKGEGPLLWASGSESSTTSSASRCCPTGWTKN